MNNLQSMNCVLKSNWVRTVILSVFWVNTVCAGNIGWHPLSGPLMTRWAKSVTPENVHSEYPRPQMVRHDWMNLNGIWDYAIIPQAAGTPTKFDGKILVPFPIESALSGVMKPLAETNQPWYRRSFAIPKSWHGRNVLLHFGAVDWSATVWVNGKEIGSHRGGYDGFSFDITDALKSSAENEIVVAVSDPTDSGTQLRGKQVRGPHGIWYTPTSGIWQTVWLEPVADGRIEKLKIVPDLDAASVSVEVLATTPPAQKTELKIEVLDKSRVIQTANLVRSTAASNQVLNDSKAVLKIPHCKSWSPDSPFLYNLRITVYADGKKVDEVKSYFGMRKISLGKDERGFTRLLLNNQPLFQFGPLDQGFWPDGIYTAPTDEAMRYDIEMTKKLGFNLARKHVKVEPDRWYYWCDKLGLLVWQDMPSGDKNIRGSDADLARSAESAAQFETEWKAIIAERFNHPCIVMWVPFNEGWGQFDTARIVNLTKECDPTRLVDNASGWTDRGVGDVNDLHNYPGPAAPKPESKRAVVLGEFGGLGLPVKGHTWQSEKNWGYRSFTNSSGLTDTYLKLVKRLHSLVGTHGLSAAVYTQTTDVEGEVNGLMTYDRALAKMNPKAISAANRKLQDPPPPPPIRKNLSPTSQEAGVLWRFTFANPGTNWMKSDFDDVAWKTSSGGFGTTGTPGGIVRTTWNTGDIWLRRTFDAPDKPDNLQLVIHHDEDAEVFINGVLAARVSGYATEYEEIPVRREAVAALLPLGNILSVHCHQKTGGQYIDVGVTNVE